MSDTAPQPPAAAKKSKKKIVWLVIGAIVALFVVISIANSGGSSDSSTSTATDTAVEAAPSAAEEVPVEEEVVEEAPAADNGFYDEAFGSFAPAIEKGKGDAIVTLPAGAAGGLVTATHKGSSNFSISVLDVDNQSTGDLLVNEIGKYQGTTAYGISSLGGEPAKLEVTADGAWTIEILPLASAPALTLPASGSGDGVFRYDGDTADWNIQHKGKSNFVVLQTADFMPNLAVNEIGNYDGKVPMQAGPSVVVIQADGKWSIS